MISAIVSASLLAIASLLPNVYASSVPRDVELEARNVTESYQLIASSPILEELDKIIAANPQGRSLVNITARRVKEFERSILANRQMPPRNRPFRSHGRVHEGAHQGYLECSNPVGCGPNAPAWVQDTLVSITSAKVTTNQVASPAQVNSDHKQTTTLAVGTLHAVAKGSTTGWNIAASLNIKGAQVGFSYTNQKSETVTLTTTRTDTGTCGPRRRCQWVTSTFKAKVKGKCFMTAVSECNRGKRDMCGRDRNRFFRGCLRQATASRRGCKDPVGQRRLFDCELDYPLLDDKGKPLYEINWKTESIDK
ncbi:hypothetical protein LOZ12_001249 [Ophidiomyces ophidiicola]|uniref:Uncharacterized protein n=1 Tax=Ophidiomyces ophidiicola TaxID=1387563 RepID=A0ACB8V2R0_9EURO|nr:hypothetical protein LOZ64_001601 [Ophidiomyces ophidiicola]KAI1950262.1 hypothetical protein LOZ62_002009 [Ophidiomyces ophidiicola]KAI1972920.1 hypothetical protein LOZ56_002114 [Ophidiomyces ophidiicola]KAI2008520.1 hypothetical protein LOZ50_001986 [Ophidiomyces ophidiicola]KAI2029486.1 hypothetical protein LOZ45_001844 [Ophidiomyces ophidiicola]